MRLISKAWVNFSLRILILRRVGKFVVSGNDLVLNWHGLLTHFLSILALLLTLSLEHGHVSKLTSLTVLEQGLELIISAFFLKNPVKLAIVLVVVALHHGLEKTSQEVIVGLLLELDVTTVLNKLHELFGHSLGQLLYSGLAFLLTNFVVLFVLIFSGEALPRQLTL